MDKELSKRNANKIMKKELIVSTAEKLFLQKDFENTSMDEISKAAGLTIRTIYQYFKSKEDLFLAVALKGTRQMSEKCEEAVKNGRTGLEKIRLINMAYYQYYINNPGTFRLINYQPDNKLNCEASPNYQELSDFKEKVLRLYFEAVDEGKSDGSIRSNLDTKNAAYFAVCSSIGLLNMVSAMEKSYIWQEEGFGESEFLCFSMNLLTDALK